MGGGKTTTVNEGTFLIRGGWGMDRGFGGGSLVNFSQLGQGQTCFMRNRGRVTVFFWQGKITPCPSYLLRNTRSA